MKDHLGSTRAVTNSSNTLIAAYDYDAWGYSLREWKSGDDAKYRFTGKERDNETNYDYFGARNYDAGIGRWGGIEPLLEKFISFSPYQYALCSPLIMHDINGFDIYYFYENGRYKGKEESKESKISVTPNNGYGPNREYKFNDSEDEGRMKKLVSKYGQKNVKFLHFLTKGDIEFYFEKSGIYSSDATDDSYAYALNNSIRKGKMDFWATAIYNGFLKKSGVEMEDIGSDGAGFFIFPNEDITYNDMDAGNHFWGGAMARLGISLDDAETGANVHDIFDGLRKFELHFGDSEADLNAIRSGYKNLKQGGGNGSW